MPLSIFIHSFFIGFVASIGLGAVTILILNRTFTQGFWPGLFSGIGSAISDTFYASVAFLGIGLFIDFVQEQQALIRLFMMVVFILYAYRIWKKQTRVNLRGRQQFKDRTLLGNLASALILALSNPLMVMVYLGVFAIFPEITQHSKTWPDGGFVLLLIFLGALLWWILLTRLIGLVSKKIDKRFVGMINKLSALILMALGIYAGVSACVQLLS